MTGNISKRWPFIILSLGIFIGATYFFYETIRNPLTLRQPVNQTKACHKEEAKGYAEVKVTRAQAAAILDNRRHFDIEPIQSQCYFIGQKLHIYIYNKKDRLILPFRVATAEIRALELYEAHQIGNERAKDLGYKSIKALKKELRHFYRGPLTKYNYLVVGYALESLDFFSARSPLLPYQLPFAQTITRQQYNQMSQKAHVVDIRTPKEYSDFHLPQARNIPYHWGKYDKNIVFANYEAMLRGGDWLDHRKFPDDKTARIIIYGQGPRDTRSLRALAMLSRQGWKNLHWYWGGIDGWLNKRMYTPAHDPRLKMAYPHEILKLLRQGARTVDVRSLQEFKDGRLPRALHLKIYRMASANQTSQVQQFQDQLNFSTKMLPPNKQRPLIFYGEDETSWEAYQAALLARQQGWKNIYWLRGGFQQWRAAGDLLSKKFRWVRNSEKDAKEKALPKGAHPAPPPSSTSRSKGQKS